jgi:hypothetical protein
LALVIGILASSWTPARAVSITTVNTTSITDDPNDGACDFWEALQAIADYHNSGEDSYHECTTGPEPHEVVFSGGAAGGTITLPTDLIDRPFTGLPFVTDDVTITGPVVIDGGGAAINAHIFITNAGGRLTLANLVVQNGYTSGAGGAILGLGGDDVLNIINSSIQNNTAEGHGGAIFFSGQVNIMASNFSGNRALGLDGGSSDYPGMGGAIYMSGYNSFSISLSNFAGNIAFEGGGAIATTADAGQISDSVFNGNIVNDDVVSDATYGGGAIYNASNNSDTGITITRVAFDGNLSFNAHGGAIYNAGDGYLHVYDSSFNGNIAGAYPRANGQHLQPGSARHPACDVLANVSSRGNGGAIANDRTGQAVFANVTFTANGAGWRGRDDLERQYPAGWAGLERLSVQCDFLAQRTRPTRAAIFNQVDGNHAVVLANTIVDGIGILGDAATST